MTVVGWLSEVYALGIRCFVLDGQLHLSRAIPEHFAYLRSIQETLEEAIIATLKTDSVEVISPQSLQTHGYSREDFAQLFAVPHWVVEYFAQGSLREGSKAMTACIGIPIKGDGQESFLSLDQVRGAITQAVHQIPWLSLQWWRSPQAHFWQSWGMGIPKKAYIDFEYFDLSAESSELVEDSKELSAVYGHVELGLDESPTIHRLIKLGQGHYYYLFCFWPGLCSPGVLFRLMDSLFAAFSGVQAKIGDQQYFLQQLSHQHSPQHHFQQQWLQQFWSLINDENSQQSLFRFRERGLIDKRPHTEQQTLMIPLAIKTALEDKCREISALSEDMLETTEIWRQLTLGLFVKIVSEYYPGLSEDAGQSDLVPIAVISDELVAELQWLQGLPSVQTLSFLISEVAMTEPGDLFLWVRRWLKSNMTQSNMMPVGAGAGNEKIAATAFPVFSVQVLSYSDDKFTRSDALLEHAHLGFTVQNEIRLFVILGEHTVRLELFYNPECHLGGLWLQRMAQYHQMILAKPQLLPNSKVPTVSKVKVSYVPGDEIRSVIDIIYNQTVQLSQAPAVVFGEASINYRTLWMSAVRGAKQLQAQGIVSGQWVLIQGVVSIELMISVLAAVLSGGAYVIIKPGLPQRIQEDIMRTFDPSVLVTLQGEVESEVESGFAEIKKVSAHDWYWENDLELLEAVTLLRREAPVCANFNWLSGQSLQRIDICYEAFTHQVLAWMEVLTGQYPLKMLLTAPVFSAEFHRQWATTWALGGTLYLSNAVSDAALATTTYDTNINCIEGSVEYWQAVLLQAEAGLNWPSQPIRRAVVTSDVWQQSALLALYHQLNPPESNLPKCEIIVGLSIPFRITPYTWYRFLPKKKHGSSDQWCWGGVPKKGAQDPQRDLGSSLQILDRFQKNCPRGVCGDVYWSQTQDCSQTQQSEEKLNCQGFFDHRKQLWVRASGQLMMYKEGWWFSLPNLNRALAETVQQVYSEFLSCELLKILAPNQVSWVAIWVEGVDHERDWREIAEVLIKYYPENLIPKQSIRLAYRPSFFANHSTVAPSQLLDQWVLAPAHQQWASHDFWSKRLTNATAFPAGIMGPFGVATYETKQVSWPGRALDLVRLGQKMCGVSEPFVWLTALQTAIQWLWPKQVWPLLLQNSPLISDVLLGCLAVSTALSPIQWVETITKHWQQGEAYLPPYLNWVNTPAINAYPKWQKQAGETLEEQPIIPFALMLNPTDRSQFNGHPFGLCLILQTNSAAVISLEVLYHPGWFQPSQIDRLIAILFNWLDYMVIYPHQPVKYFYQSLSLIKESPKGSQYPLTPWQQEFLNLTTITSSRRALAQPSQTQHSWNLGWLDLMVSGSLDLLRWQSALDVQARHFVALRLRLHRQDQFVPSSVLQSTEPCGHQGDSFYQVVFNDVDAILNCEELSDASQLLEGDVFESYWREWVADKLIRPLAQQSIEQAPLVHFYAIYCQRNRWRLLVVAHPLALDEQGIHALFVAWVQAYATHAEQRLESYQSISDDEYAGFLKWSQMPTRVRIAASDSALECSPASRYVHFNGVFNPAPREETHSGDETVVDGNVVDGNVLIEEHLIDKNMWCALTAKAEQAGVPIQWVIQAAYTVLLASYLTLEDSLTMFVRQENRSARYRHTLGAFSHYRIFDVPLQIMFDKQATVADMWSLLRRWVGSTHHSPLFESESVAASEDNTDKIKNALYVFFAFQNELPAISLGNTKEAGHSSLSVCLDQYERFKNALTLTGREHHQALKLIWQYPKNQLKETQFLSRLSHILDQWLSGTERLADFDLLLPDEKAIHYQFATKSNRRIANWPPLYRLVEEQAQRTPKQVAVQQGQLLLTYWQLHQLSNQIANRLIKLGCKPGETLVLCTGKNFYLPAAMLATWKIGAHFIPVNSSVSEVYWQSVFDMHHIRFALTSSRYQKRYESLNAELSVINLAQFDPGLETPLMLKEKVIRAASQKVNQPVYMLNQKLRGTEEHCPRSIHILSESLINLVQWYCGELGWKSDDRVLLLANMDFNLALKNIWAALVTGAQIIFGDSNVYDPEQIAQDIKTHHITRLSTTPSAFYPLLNTQMVIQDGPAVFEALTTLVLGNEPVRYSDIRPFLANYPHCGVLCTYNIEVCTDVVAYHWVRSEAIEPTSETKFCKEVKSCEYVPLGHPINRQQLFIMDPLGRLQPQGLVGQVAVLGAGVGHLVAESKARAAESSATTTKDIGRPQAFVRVPDIGYLYYTGDLAGYDESGALIFMGQKGGARPSSEVDISFKQIEQRLQTFSGVLQARLQEVPDKGLVAYLQIQQPAQFRPESIKNKLAWLYPNARLPDVYCLELQEEDDTFQSEHFQAL